MYAGAIAVPLIVGRALKLTPEQVALLISADLFCLRHRHADPVLGMTRWFGIKLPVMMGVTFAAVGPMVAFANAMPGVDGARAIFGAIIGAGMISMLIAPIVSKLLRFFPPVVTGTIIAIIGISLMRVGIGWAMGGPAFLAQIDRRAQAGGDGRRRQGRGCRPRLRPSSCRARSRCSTTRTTARSTTWRVAGAVLVLILLLVKYTKGFIANISVLLGIVAGCVVAMAMGKMNFDKVAKAHWFDVVTPFAFGMPTFDIVMILTMTLVMIVVMIESTGMFLALSDITGKKIEPGRAAAGPAHRRPGHADRRHLQHLPVHQLLAERRPGRRHRREEPLGLRGRRR